MDVDTVKAVLSTQLKDVRELLVNEMRLGKPGELTDPGHALTLQAQELRKAWTRLNDNAMAQSISRAVQDDFPALAAEIATERQAERDHHAAVKLDNPEAPTPTAPFKSAMPNVPHEIALRRLIPLNFAKVKETYDWLFTHGTPQDGKKDTSHDDSVEAHCECAVCYEDSVASKVYNAPCGHLYCHGCVYGLYVDALRDDTLFPPKCCRKEFPLSTVRSIIGVDLVQSTEQKLVEIRTVDKTYCCNPSCARFIMPYDILELRGKCTSCFTTTCTRCKKATHQGPCDAPNEVEMVTYAESQGWKRCYQCRAFVELNHGCNHVTCRCRAEMCYVCGSAWTGKTCANGCALWEEANLLRRAEARVARNRPAPGVDLVAAANVVAAGLRVNPICLHDGDDAWIKIRERYGGEFECEECQEMHRWFIWECEDCGMRKCTRCMMNR